MTPGELAGLRAKKLALHIGKKRFGWPGRGSLTKTAKFLGVDRSYLHRIVNAERPSVGMETVETICEMTGISPRYFTQPARDGDESTVDPEGFMFGAPELQETGESGALRQWPVARALAQRFTSLHQRSPTRPPLDIGRLMAGMIAGDPTVHATIEVMRAEGDEELQLQRLTRLALYLVGGTVTTQEQVWLEPDHDWVVHLPDRNSPVGYRRTEAGELEALGGPELVPASREVLQAIAAGALTPTIPEEEI